MIFLDASAMVAMLAGEPQASALFRRLDAASGGVTSPLAVFETVAALARKLGQEVEAVEGQVREFLAAANVAVVPIADVEARGALAAYARFGKGLGHPARLNMGDCFAYAGARARGLPLLYVGEDFPRTDIPSALA